MRFLFYVCMREFYVRSFQCVLVLGMRRGVLCKGTPVCFDNKSTEKNICYNLCPPNFFIYREHPLKPLQPIEEVVANIFLNFFPNFVTLKSSAMVFSL
jgi:hypothetical protein